MVVQQQTMYIKQGDGSAKFPISNMPQYLLLRKYRRSITTGKLRAKMGHRLYRKIIYDKEIRTAFYKAMLTPQV
jgi:hypothetical protein